MESSTVLRDIIPILRLMKLRLREGRGLSKVCPTALSLLLHSNIRAQWVEKKLSLLKKQKKKITHKLVILYYTERLAKDSFSFVKESPSKISSDSSGDAVNIIKQ